MPLYLVSTPIGNPDDITLRAIETLKNADLVICEEFKEGSKLLKRLEIKKELFSLNEHNEEEDSQEIIEMLYQGKNIALFSDCGTPVFADPGRILVQRCHQSGIQVIPVPGASSILSALVVAGIDIRQFYYAGFLPRNKEERREELKRFKNIGCPVVLMDTPYRIVALLEDIKHELSGKCKVTIGFCLTKENEEILKDSVTNVLKTLGSKPEKREFVLIIEPEKVRSNSSSRSNQGKSRRNKKNIKY